MSVPRTLSLSGLLVALACSLTACGPSDKNKAEFVPPAAAPASTSTTPAGTNPLTATLAAGPHACNFLTLKEVKTLLPNATKGTGIPASCAWLTSTKKAVPSVGFFYISKAIITNAISTSAKKDQTIPGAFVAQMKASVGQDGYATVKGLGDYAYSQHDTKSEVIRWFVKDHAFYLTVNYGSGKSKSEPSLKKLIAVAKKVPDPSKVKSGS
jgi:hypothetical protein